RGGFVCWECGDRGTGRLGRRVQTRPDRASCRVLECSAIRSGHEASEADTLKQSPLGELRVEIVRDGVTYARVHDIRGQSIPDPADAAGTLITLSERTPQISWWSAPASHSPRSR